MSTTDDPLRRIDAGIGDAGLMPGAARHRHRGPVEVVHDLVEVSIPHGGRAAVVSDLHLTGTVTEASRGCTDEMVRLLSDWDEPGAFVINGDGFEQLHEPVAPMEEIFDAHHEWAEAVRAFAAQPDHHVVVLSGNHDGNIAWDPEVAATVQRRLGAEHLAIAADLVFDTGAGEQRVHVVHGNQDDQYNAFSDPRSPIDTPTGHHIVRQVLPHVEGAAKEGGLLEGLYGLSEPMTVGEMIGSRLLYRGVGKKAVLLVLPFVAALLLRIVAFMPVFDDVELWSDLENWMVGLGISVVVVLILGVLVAFLTLLGVHHALASTELGQRAGVGAHNAATREHAARVIELGYAGMIAGHTHAPELSVVGEGFYANSGCGVEVLGPRHTRLGLPRPFTSVRRISRVELVAADDLEVRLVIGDVPAPMAVLERLVSKPDRDTPTKPSVVASLPTGATWPVDPTELSTYVRMRLARRSIAVVLPVVAFINLVTTLFGASLNNMALFAAHIPDEVPEGSRAFGTLIAISLLLLTPGVRRGYRQTWMMAIVLLLTNAIVLVSWGIFFEEALLNLAAAVWLLVEGRHFRMLVSGRRRLILWVATVAIAAMGVLTVLVIWVDEAAGSVFGRIGIVVVVVLGVVVGSVVRATRKFHLRTGEARLTAERAARQLLTRHGGDTFDESAIRPDKALLFAGGGLVAYTVIDKRMLISPDPICALDDRSDVWASTLDYADRHGWRIAVLGASATWLPIYHTAAMHDVYVGDEAVVDCSRFFAEPPLSHTIEDECEYARGRGYHVQVVAVDAVDATTRARLEELAVDAELGAPGRGFVTSMGRVAGPADEGALLALCRSEEGEIVAFDQFLPARNIGGYVLDLASTVRLGDDAESVGHLLLVESLHHLYAHDVKALSLGLAASGTTSYGEARGKLPLEPEILSQFASATELERRRRVDQQYGPLWRPRYLVADTMRRSHRRGLRSRDV